MYFASAQIALPMLEAEVAGKTADQSWSRSRRACSNRSAEHFRARTMPGPCYQPFE